MLVRRVVVGPLQANCYVVVDEATSSAAVIDPGADVPTISRIILGSGASLTHILLTHGHPDHAFAAGQLQEDFPDAEALMHEADIGQLQAVHVELAALLIDLGEHHAFKPTGYLLDSQQLRVGDTEISVLHTPGHTPGSVCLRIEGALFTGDTIFALGIGRTDLPGGSYEELIASIRLKILGLPDDTILYPGHGLDSTVGEEKRGNPWL